MIENKHVLDNNLKVVHPDFLPHFCFLSENACLHWISNHTKKLCLIFGLTIVRGMDMDNPNCVLKQY